MSDNDPKNRDMKKFDEIARGLTTDILLRGGVCAADEHYRSKIFKEAVESLGGVSKLRGKSILDLGGGPASYTVPFARFMSKVMCLDLSSEMLKKGKERAGLHNVQIEFTRGDAEALPFSNRSFDYVVGFLFLHHIVKWQECLREMARVAKLKVLVVEPNGLSLPHAVNELLYLYRLYRDGWKIKAKWSIKELHHFTPQQIQREFIKLNMAKIDVKLAGFIPTCWPIPRSLIKPLSLAEQICEKVPFFGYSAGNIIAVGSK